MKSLFVGNMSFQTTEGDLRALFEAYGKVTRVHLATDRETGRARGFAFSLRCLMMTRQPRLSPDLMAKNLEGES